VFLALAKRPDRRGERAVDLRVAGRRGEIAQIANKAYRFVIRNSPGRSTLICCDTQRNVPGLIDERERPEFPTAAGMAHSF
jgi:hypothetical protein